MRGQVCLDLLESEAGVTAEDRVLDGVNLRGKVLYVLVRVLLVVHHGLVNDVPAVAEDIVEDEDHHQREREHQDGEENDHDDERHDDSEDDEGQEAEEGDCFLPVQKVPGETVPAST